MVVRRRTWVCAATVLLASASLSLQARAQPSIDWADARAEDKGCRDGARIFHVRCERSDRERSERCLDMPRREFRGSAMTAAPIRLPDKVWTEVAIDDPSCTPAAPGPAADRSASSTSPTDSPTDHTTPKPPTKGEAAASPAPTEPICDAEKVAQCRTLLQGRVPWQMRLEPQYRHWQQYNLDNLCQCTQDPPQTVLCFQTELHKHNNDWTQAIELCRAR